MAKHKITGLIVSAGLSLRMGKLKPLIKYNETPFLAHIIQKIKPVCQKIIIVTGHQSAHIYDEISDWLKENDTDVSKIIHWCYNADFETGMLSSLQKGLELAARSDWILYHFVDQPAIPHDFYSDLTGRIHVKFDWIQPMHKGQHGHPLLFSGRMIPEIMSLNSTHSLRDIAKDEKLRKHIYDCDFPEILNDYDTPQDLKDLIKRE